MTRTYKGLHERDFRKLSLTLEKLAERNSSNILLSRYTVGWTYHFIEEILKLSAPDDTPSEVWAEVERWLPYGVSLVTGELELETASSVEEA